MENFPQLGPSLPESKDAAKKKNPKKNLLQKTLLTAAFTASGLFAGKEAVGQNPESTPETKKKMEISSFQKFKDYIASQKIETFDDFKEAVEKHPYIVESINNDKFWKSPYGIETDSSIVFNVEKYLGRYDIYFFIKDGLLDQPAVTSFLMKNTFKDGSFDIKTEKDLRARIKKELKKNGDLGGEAIYVCHRDFIRYLRWVKQVKDSTIKSLWDFFKNSKTASYSSGQ
ncbi:MAG: hypothetical protein V4665_01845 [Patescibacteria group bacterium]